MQDAFQESSRAHQVQGFLTENFLKGERDSNDCRYQRQEAWLVHRSTVQVGKFSKSYSFADRYGRDVAHAASATQCDLQG